MTLISIRKRLISSPSRWCASSPPPCLIVFPKGLTDDASQIEATRLLSFLIMYTSRGGATRTRGELFFFSTVCVLTRWQRRQHNYCSSFPVRANHVVATLPQGYYGRFWCRRSIKVILLLKMKQLSEPLQADCNWARTRRGKSHRGTRAFRLIEAKWRISLSGHTDIGTVCVSIAVTWHCSKSAVLFGVFDWVLLVYIFHISLLCRIETHQRVKTRWICLILIFMYNVLNWHFYMLLYLTAKHRL